MAVAAVELSLPLRMFVDRMDDAVERERSPARLAREAATRLLELLMAPKVLPAWCRDSDSERYRQHVLYVHQRGLYSLVALVWRPGQATPIHDHRCWCVVGVLEGSEEETRYHFASDGDERWLVPVGSSFSPVGSVGVLIPPAENIHRVSNGGDTLAVSLHVYGADIGACGSSINRVFEEPVRDDAAGDSLAWRAA